MTRTEDRLTDALAAVARGVQEQGLPPLPSRSPGSGRQRWGQWLAPAAAAAGVTVIVALVSAMHLFSGTPGEVAPASGPPRYYATNESSQILVRRTATGAVVARIANPLVGAPFLGPHDRLPLGAMGVAAAAGDQEFAAAYSSMPEGSFEQTRLYLFHLTSAGRVTGFSQVKGGVIPGMLASGVMAVSPDGSQAALAVYRQTGLTSPPSAPTVVVINLRTGAHRAWSGGLGRAGLTLTIPSISWSPGSRSLVFLSQWCKNSIVGGICARGPHAAQVRTLSLAARGGRLSSGGVLLSESAHYPEIVQALLSPDGKAITLVALDGSYRGRRNPVPQDLRVIRVPLGSGGQPQLLYHGVVGRNRAAVFLGSDATGRYLLLAWRLNGWIDHGVLRHLAAHGGSAFAVAW